MKTYKKATNSKTIRIVLTIAAYSALAAVAGFIKLPSPVGSVALDSCPGFFVSINISPLLGGVVGLVGHLASAANAGFPVGPLHFAVAVGMFFCSFAYGAISRFFDSKWGLLWASLTALILNCLIPFACVPLGFPIEAAYALVFPFLIFAASINIAIAGAVTLLLSKIKSPSV
jgi:uncharacterized membrane protein